MLRHIFVTKIKTATRTPSFLNFGRRLSQRHGDSFTQCLSECPDAEFVVFRFLNSRIKPLFTWLRD